MSVSEEHIKLLKRTSGLEPETLALAEIETSSGLRSKELIDSPSSGIAFPYWDLEGAILGHRIKLDTPFSDGGKYLQKKGVDLNVYFLKGDIPLLQDNRKTLFITEGEKKCLALRQVLDEGSAVCAIPGCWNWSKEKELAPILKKIPFKRDVVLVPDGDFFFNTNVKDGFTSLISSLTKEGAKVSLVDLRDGKGGKIGVDDYLLAHGKDSFLERLQKPFWEFEFFEEIPKNLNDDEIEKLLAKSILLRDIEKESLLIKVKKASSHDKSTLRRSLAKHTFVFENRTDVSKGPECFWDKSAEPLSYPFSYITKALSEDENIFICPNSSNLLHVVKDEIVRILEGVQLSHLLATKVQFYSASKDSPGYKPWPIELCSSYLANITKYSSLRPLKKLAMAPVFVNGTLIHSPGYYEREMTLYIGDEVKPKYTFERLEEVTSFFPVKSGSDKTNLLATLIAPSLNQSFVGQRGFYLIKGDSPDLGKTSIAHMCSIIHKKKDARDFTYPESDTEFEKALFSHLQKSDFVCADNARHINSSRPIASGSLERIITSAQPAFRVLGKSESVEIENNFSIFLTLNAGTFSKDLITRALPIFLTFENKCVMPQGFDFQPKEYAHKHRDEILSEIVGLIEVWMKKGCPLVLVPGYNKFPKWAATLNGLMHVLGKTNFLSNFSEQASKLDPISSGLLSLAEGELEENTPSTQTAFRIAGEWRELLEERAGNSLFETTEIRGKDVRLGLAMTSMLGQIFIVTINEEKRPISIQKIRETSGGKQSLYSFKLLDKTPGEELSIVEAYDPNLVSIEPNGEWTLPNPTLEKTKFSFGKKIVPTLWWDGSKNIGDEFSYDIETSLVEQGKYPEIVLASAYSKKDKTVYFLRPDDLKNFIETHKKATFVGHNIAFDLCTTAHHIGETSWVFQAVEEERVYDTYVLERLITLATEGDASNKKGKFTLATCVKNRLGEDLPKEATINGEVVRTSYAKYLGKLDGMPSGYYYYNAFDTISNLHLLEAQKKAVRGLSKDNKLLSHNIQVKALFGAFLTSSLGIGVDKDGVLKLKEAQSKKLDELNKELLEKYNFSFGTGKEKRFNEVLAKLEEEQSVSFVKYTHKSGKQLYRAATEDLEAFAHVEFVRLYLEREKTNKRIKTFLSKLEGTERIHPNIHILKNTGRLSMSSPNLQQIPRPTEDINFRSLFIPKPGHKFVSVDFVAAELVTLAQTCVDMFGKSALGDALNSGVDVHRLTASTFLNKPMSEVSSLERQSAKAANFGYPGGLSPKSFVRVAKNSYGLLDMTEEEATRIREAWFRTYPELKKYLDHPNEKLAEALVVHDHEREKKYLLHTFLGVMGGRDAAKTSGKEYSEKDIAWSWENARKLIPKFKKLLKYRGDILNKKPSEALEDCLKNSLTAVTFRTGRLRANCGFCDYNNNAFQSLLSDIANIGMFNLHKEKYSVVLPVHDEIVVEVPEDRAEEAKLEIERILLSAARELCPDIQMRLESGISDCWGKAQ